MRVTCIVITALLLTHVSFSQVENMSQLGGKSYFYDHTNNRSAIGFVYSFRKNFINSYQSSLSVGTHTGVGFTDLFKRKSFYSTVLIDIPLLIEYNAGYGATKKVVSKFGGYLGAGYALHKNALPEIYKTSAWLHGPVVTAGIRFKLTGIAPLDLGGSFMLDAKNSTVKTNIFGVSLSYMFGLK